NSELWRQDQSCNAATAIANQAMLGDVFDTAIQGVKTAALARMVSWYRLLRCQVAADWIMSETLRPARHPSMFWAFSLLATSIAGSPSRRGMISGAKSGRFSTSRAAWTISLT